MNFCIIAVSALYMNFLNKNRDNTLKVIDYCQLRRKILIEVKECVVLCGIIRRNSNMRLSQASELRTVS